MKIDTAKFGSKAAVSSFASLMGNDARDIQQLSIDTLTPYPNQPFSVRQDEALQALADDIQQNGILFPVLVRPFGANYQILAGHRRTAAAKLIGLTQIPCIVKTVDDATAKLILTNTNLTHRQKLLPSERAFAYLMQKEALEELGAHRVRTTAQIAEENKESVRMIQYYLQLTKLVKSMLELVDEERIPVKIGAALSTRSDPEQEVLAVFLAAYPSVKPRDSQWQLLLHLPTITEETLIDFFFPSKEEPEYNTYIVSDKELLDVSERLHRLCSLGQIKDGKVLERKKYQRFQAAQQIIQKQITALEKLLN